jgi:hypothetical protein
MASRCETLSVGSGLLEEPRSESGLPKLYLYQLVHLSTTVVNAAEYINLATAYVTSRNGRELMAALIARPAARQPALNLLYFNCGHYNIWDLSSCLPTRTKLRIVASPEKYV